MDSNLWYRRKAKVYMKKKSIIIITMISVIVCSVGTFFIWKTYFFLDPKKEESKTSLTTTNTNAALFTTMQQIDEISGFSKVEAAAFEGRRDEIDHGMYVIPGLEATKMLSMKTGKESMCTSMTPQGLAIAENYLLISAYCHTKEHHSVVWVIDKKTHDFIKEIVLEGDPHAGGMAYDEDHRNIWVCSKKGKTPQLVAFTLSQLEEYELSVEKKAICYSQQFDLIGLKDASFVGYKNDNLYVGYFTQHGTSVLQRYRIDQEGELREKITNQKDAKIEIAQEQGIFDISNDMQGMSEYKGNILLSRSNGPFNDSHLLVFDAKKTEQNFEDKYAIHKYAFPERMEQIVVEGNDLYVLFESAAYAYRHNGNTHVDRVLKIDLSRLLGK